MSTGMEKFIENLKINIDAFEDAELSAETKFKDMDSWDSLALISMMAMFASEYGINISAAEINACDTISDLFSKANIK